MWAFSRIPTGFIPYEDQGYMLSIVQLPDGASLARTQKALAHVSAIARKNPGVKEVVTIAGVSPLDNNATLSSSGVAYIILKDWAVRGKKYGLRNMLTGLNDAMSGVEEAQVRVLPPPPIQGVGFAAGFTMQVNLQDGSSDYTKLARIVRNTVSNAASQSEIQMAMSSFRAETPQYTVDLDRVKAQSMHVNVNDVFNALAGYLGSTYVNQFNKFGRTFRVFVQAGPDYRQRLEDISHLTVSNAEGKMVPLGTLVSIKPAMGPSLISLYNLYPSATIIGLPRQGYSSGQAMGLMNEIANKTFPPHVSSLWSAMSYQENLVGNQMYMVFGMALLLVYLVLAGQYESWYRPLAVLCAVPIALHRSGGGALGAAHRQQPLYPDRHRASDRAVGEERHPDRRVRARAPRSRQADRGSRGGSRTRPLPADPDDLVRLHPGRPAAGPGHRRRRQRARFDRHRGVHRHARLDLHRDPVRAVVLRGHPALRGMAPGAQGQAGAGVRHGVGRSLPATSPATRPARSPATFWSRSAGYGRKRR